MPRSASDYDWSQYGGNQGRDAYLAGTYTPPGGESGGGGGSSGASFSTEAEYDPRLTTLADQVAARNANPEGSTGRAIDRSTSKIRDATEGRRSALRSMMASRGVLAGTSIPEMMEGQLSEQEGRQVAGNAADISLARERDNDQFLLGSTAALRAPGDAAARDRQMGQDAYFQQQQLQMQRDRMQMDQYMQQLNLLQSLGGGF